MHYQIKTLFQIKYEDIPKVVHPYLLRAYYQKTRLMSRLDDYDILLVEQLPFFDGVLDPSGNIRYDVDFTLRGHLNYLIKQHQLGENKVRQVGGAYRPVEEPPKPTKTEKEQADTKENRKRDAYQAMVAPQKELPEYEKTHGVTKKTINVTFPTIEEMLENPELDSINSVNIDPISMAVETVVDLIDGAKEFVSNPSLGGVAAMAAIAIPGRLMDDSVRKFIGKYKGKDIELENISINTLDYKKRDREEYTQLRKEFDNSIRKNYLKDLSKNTEVVNQLKSHGVKDSEIAKLADAKVPRGYQVHHKIPLDDGGNNNYENLVLIRNTPEHSVFTTYQKQQTSNLSVGSSVSVQWPSPNGSVYPKK